MIVVHEMQFLGLLVILALVTIETLMVKPVQFHQRPNVILPFFEPVIETMVTVEALVEPVQLRQRPNVKFNFANIDSWENSNAKLGI